MNMTVTNLRLPEHRYRKYKAIAAEEGLSFNTFVSQILEEKTTEKQFGKSNKRKKKDFYSAMEELLADGHKNEPMGLSEEDEIIYG